MKTIEEMLKSLARPGVTEFALSSGRLPCAKVDGTYAPEETSAPNTDTILQMLVSTGGSRYVDDLGEKPVQWTTRVDGLGVVAVTAIMRAGTVQARYILKERAAPVVFAASVQEVQLDEAPASDISMDLELDLGAERAVVPFAPASTARDFDIDMTRPAAPVKPPAAPVAARPPAMSPATPFVAFSPAAVAAIAGKAAATTPELAGLLEAARREGASDLHVIAERPALFRIAGELVPRGESLSAARVEKMLRDNVPARLVSLLDDDGSCDYALQHERLGRFRVNVSRQRTGLKGCFRILAAEVPTLHSLGLPMAITEATHHHQGLILVTGPTGHGKTSTLAAIVDIINSESTHHIITVEDPIEFMHPRKRALMSQREVGQHTKSFAAALKASLREDPDVIVVGELRDPETVRMALSASETGHLVLGTMNTPSAAKTIDRLIDLFPPGDQGQVRMTLAGGLRLIVSQRLVQGAKGELVAVAELLPGSVPLWSLIRDNRTFQIPSLQQRGKSIGIIRMEDAFGELVRGGRVTDAVARAELAELARS
ncbi:MAG: Twitching motility protein PilT [Myxococcaceae bacterium]|nr:Twitching motility protein PilT [Myxococcaceae bacterium]